MYGGRTLGVVVPAYNEREHVAGVLEAMPAFVDRCYVVDDGSTDGTWEVVERVAAERNGETGDGPTFVPIRHERNRGAGAAIRTGYQRALAEGVDVTVTIDADGQMDPRDMPRVIDPVVSDRADYAKGDRLGSGQGQMPAFRWVGNWLLTELTRVASGYWHLRDPQNGYTAISHRALSAIDVDSLFAFYGYSNDVLIRLNAASMRVADVPMASAYGDERSSIRYTSYVPAVSWLLLRRFCWRLVANVRTRSATSVGLCYLLGFAVAGFGLLQLVAVVAFDGVPNQLASVTSLPGVVPPLVIGWLFAAIGMVADRQASRPLEVRGE